MVSIPFDAINVAALAQFSSLLREWFPNGKRVGHEWRVGSINGEAGESFGVNMQTGKWAEFNGRGETGGDVISLYAAKFFQGDRLEAARNLAGTLGIEIKLRQLPKPKLKPNDGSWVPLIPPPPDAGRASDEMVSGFDMLHRYTSLDGRETHFVGRIEARGKKDKQFIPITYGELNGVRAWLKKAPNPPRPLYGLHKLTAMPDVPVLLCEGEKAADAAQRLFPDQACISWFGGVAQVKHADLTPLANRVVIVWPDADAPGLNAMRKLLPRLAADTQVVRADGLPEKFDAADLEHQGCHDPTAWLNERLMPVREFHSDGPPPGDASEQQLAGDATGLVLPRRFSLNDCGLWYQPPAKNNGTEPDAVWVCGPLQVIAETDDSTHHNHGLLLGWVDRFGHEHKWAMPWRMVHQEGNTIAAELQDAGLRCSTSRPAHEFLKHFLGQVSVQRRVRCVDHAGWHDTLYVLPNGRVFGVDAGSIVLQTERAAAGSAYVERGTLDEWRDNVACYAVGNDLLTFAISEACAAPLVDVLGEPSGGVHLHGTSQTGKTTLLRSAMSVYGPADDKHMRTWRATANGLEAVAAETSDGLLTLDEISQANAREVDQVIYMLANNAGKARANRAGGARQPRNWRTLFLSTGEITLEAKLSEAGQRVRAGQDVRMIGLSADAGSGLGVFQVLHGFPSGAALAEHLRAAASTYCGTAGPAYLDQLTHERAGDPGALVKTLCALCQQFLDAHVPSDADGQVRSVAKRFALIAAAGELATAFGITGWPEDEALRAAGTCFKRWLSSRGGAGAAEDMRAVERVRSFIIQHGSSRFEALLTFAGGGEGVPEQRVVINRAGWKRLKDGVWEFLIPTDTWRREVCDGLDPSRVATVVAKRGFLLGATAEHKADAVRIPGHGRLRLYRVSAAILESETDGK